MPADPVWPPVISIIGECEFRFLHQVVVGETWIRSCAIWIAHVEMDTRLIWRRSACRHSECRNKVCCERVSVWTAVVRVLIVNLVLENRDSALLAGQEVHVRSDDEGLVSAR